MSKLKIAVIGPGLIGKQHIKLIQGHPLTELSSIVAPDSAVNASIARDLRVPLYPLIETCIANHDLDGVIISSPNKFHAEQAEICMKAGLPVLIEKPITSTIEEGRELLQIAAKSGARVLIGHHRAHSPILKKARQAILTGRLGRLVSVIGSAQFYKPQHYFDEGPWRKEVGGGPILINLIHEIGNLRTLMGEITAVQAISSSNIRRYDVEDTVAINIIFVNGALGTFLLSDTAATAKSWEQTSRENKSYPSYTDEDCYTIAGTLGSLAVPTMRLKYYSPGTDASWWKPFLTETIETNEDDPLSCQYKNFVEVIRGNESPLVSIEDGFKNLLVIEAIKKAAVSRSIVYL